MNCYLLQKCKAEHNLATSSKYTEKLYRVGRLFGGRATCLWCLFHLENLVKPVANDSDYYGLEQLKKKFPNYWRIIQEEGVDKVRRELTMQWIEAEPSSLPTRPEQLYSKLTVEVDGTR